MKKKKVILSGKDLFSGAGQMARRRAFSADLPVAILENGSIYYVYSDGSKKEVVRKDLVPKNRKR